MRILKVTQSYAPFFEFGGPPVKVRALAEGLARRGHVVTVLTADWGLDRRLRERPEGNGAEASPFGRRWKVNGVTAEYLGNWLHYRTLSWNPALGRYLKARLKDFEVAHIFGLYDFFGPRVGEECRKRNIPYVVEPIGMYLPIVRNIALKRMYHRIWGREMLSGASAIIATAEQERDELVAGGIPESRIVLRRNGVETPARLPERGEFRKKLGIPKEPGDVRLVFVGPDESGMKSRLEQVARQAGVAGRVLFCPALEGEPKWEAYRDADIFALPSQNENFGNTAAEAVVAGTPVVVTDRCGIAPFLKGVSGVVVRHEEEDLRQVLRRLLRDKPLYDQLRAGCATAAAGLGWDEPMYEMEVLYSRLAGHDRS
jgi:glycosyltransferase involved in cell wall biosynthesis